MQQFNSTFSKEELQRYARHFVIPDFGMKAQAKLKEAKVLVVGAGGLGCPLLQYLTAAGVGNLGIVDFDVVDHSNLQRQVLYTVDDIGKYKAEVAKKRMEALNPNVNITTYLEALTSENALEIIQEYDVVADGTDNFPTRYLVNDACVLAQKINVYASIFRFEGQVSVFNYPYSDGRWGPNYRDLFPEPPPPDMVPNCAEGGVLGVLPGIIGSLQASEVIKVITETGDPLVGRLFLFDAAAFTTQILKFNKTTNTKITELIDYQAFCGFPAQDRSEDVTEMTISEYRSWKAENKDFLLIDVREAFEYQVDHMGGLLLPLGEIEKSMEKIPKDKPVIVHCKSGQRSAKAIRKLQKQGYQNLINLKGGIVAWRALEDHKLAAKK